MINLRHIHKYTDSLRAYIYIYHMGRQMSGPECRGPRRVNISNAYFTLKIYIWHICNQQRAYLTYIMCAYAMYIWHTVHLPMISNGPWGPAIRVP